MAKERRGERCGRGLLCITDGALVFFFILSYLGGERGMGGDDERGTRNAQLEGVWAGERKLLLSPPVL